MTQAPPNNPYELARQAEDAERLAKTLAERPDGYDARVRQALLELRVPLTPWDRSVPEELKKAVVGPKTQADLDYEARCRHMATGRDDPWPPSGEPPSDDTTPAVPSPTQPSPAPADAPAAILKAIEP